MKQKEAQRIHLFGKRWIITEKAEVWADAVAVAMFAAAVALSLYVVPALVVIFQDMMGGK